MQAKWCATLAKIKKVKVCLLHGFPKAIFYLTPKVGGPVCNTAVEKPGNKPDT
jgi:hypothetical protein